MVHASPTPPYWLAEAGVAASRLLQAANGLTSQSDRLKSEVRGFIDSLVAA